jgi:hypothetical protein
MPSYNIVEPHPTPATPIIHVGRGGSGNVSRVRPSNLTYGPSASGPASRTKLSSPPSNSVFMSGRGGAGNAHLEKERAIFSFDEELAAQSRMTDHAAPVYHVGRGGAGNAIDERSVRSNSTSSADSAAGSFGAEHKKRASLEGAFRTLSKTFSRS